MVWARVMRGISSMAKALTLVSAASSLPYGSMLPMRTWSLRMAPRSALQPSGLAARARTCSRTSALEKTSSRPTILAPFSV